MYYVDADAIVILDVFKKKTRATSKKVIEVCNEQLRAYRSVRDS